MLPVLSQVVINTRPIERAAPLTQCLQAAGATVVDMPMLALEQRDSSSADMAIMRQWMAGDYQALVIVSPTAAEAGLAAWQALKPSLPLPNKEGELVPLQAPSLIIAVGAATAAVLQQAPVPIEYQILQPVIANNESMLAMPEIERLQADDKLLVWRGLGGRRLLVDTLKARGVHIDSIAWYERRLPKAAHMQYQQWQLHWLAQPILPVPKPIVIISSGTALEHWMSVVNQAPLSDAHAKTNPFKRLQLTDFTYVVLGARLAVMAAAAQLTHYRVEDLAPETLLATIYCDE